MLITKEKPRNVKETNYINFIDFTSHPIGGMVNEWDDCEYCDMVNVTAMSYIKRVKLCQNLITNAVKIYYADNSTEIFAMTNGYYFTINGKKIDSEISFHEFALMVKNGDFDNINKKM